MAKIIFEWVFGYAMIWWLVWFVALPFGVEDEAEGQGKIDDKKGRNIGKNSVKNVALKNLALSSAAPKKIFLYRKFVIVSISSAIIATILQLAIYKL